MTTSTSSSEATASSLRLDRAFKPDEALSADALHRKDFALAVTKVLQRVTPQSGLVLAVEGPWGCGKSSVLAMVEALLKQEPESQRPVVVHFNPWLVGERDALLRQFLASVAKAVSLTEHAKVGKRVAKELKTYSKAFDVLKLVPGAEPWASMVKSVVEAMGHATDAVFDYKTPDLETAKGTLEKALSEFPKRIIVLIDDLDRLYPAEAYEMVRIIKAVGDLPHVGYVLAWDEKYVSTALDKLQVPFASQYLDKVVQVRLPVPPLSFSQRLALVNKGLSTLPDEASQPYFQEWEARITALFHIGLHELIDSPRDAVRLFDIVAAIEPGLRGEIQLADILGLAALVTKAPAVYELLRRKPYVFHGHRPNEYFSHEQELATLGEGAKEIDAAIKTYASADALRRVVEWLFPKTALERTNMGHQVHTAGGGRLADPERLSLALHLSARPDDMSLVQVRKFITHAETRLDIVPTLLPQTCSDFLMQVGNMAKEMPTNGCADWSALALDVARLIETPPFIYQVKNRKDALAFAAEMLAEHVIEQIATQLDEEEQATLATRIIQDEQALSMAARFLLRSMDPQAQTQSKGLSAPESVQGHISGVFAYNIQKAAQKGCLFEKVAPRLMLSTLAKFLPEVCVDVMSAIRQKDADFDLFVEVMMRHSFGSSSGQVYCRPEGTDALEQYISVSDLEMHAVSRLKDATLDYPLRAAWRAAAGEGPVRGRDGHVDQI